VAQHLGPRRVRSRKRVEGWGRVKVLLNSLMPADAPADVRRYSTTTVTPDTRPTPLPSPPPTQPRCLSIPIDPLGCPFGGFGVVAASLSAASLLALTIYPRVCARRRVPCLGRRRLATRAHAAPRPSEGVGAAAATYTRQACPAPRPRSGALTPRLRRSLPPLALRSISVPALALSSRACPAPCVPLRGAGVAAATFTPSLSTS